jgi:hypothetical protein
MAGQINLTLILFMELKYLQQVPNLTKVLNSGTTNKLICNIAL